MALPIPPRGEAEVAVSYEQGCRGDEFTYVLTSTRKWRRPVDDASFAVEVSPQLAPLEGSYELEEVAAGEGVVRYELRRDGFYPDVDLNLRWHPADVAFGATTSEAHPEAPTTAAGD